MKTLSFSRARGVWENNGIQGTQAEESNHPELMYGGVPAPPDSGVLKRAGIKENFRKHGQLIGKPVIPSYSMFIPALGVRFFCLSH